MWSLQAFLADTPSYDDAFFSPLLGLYKSASASAGAMLSHLGLLASLALASQAVSIAEINGIAWRSPYEGQVVSNVTGVVTARGPSGIWIQGDDVADPRVSTGLYVFGSSIVNKTVIGDKISLSGKVSEYRSSNAYLYLTELISPTNLVILSTGNTVTPLVIGADRTPPTQALSALDNAAGPDGWLQLPNNQTQLGAVNATLQPDKYGLDFWESLSGRLVTIRKPTALNFENQYGEFWVRGDWSSTGVNARGGLTMTFGPDGIPDANPEVILVDTALDGTKSPTAAVGMTFADITGVVQYQFGFYYLIPLTAPTVLTKPEYNPEPSPFTASADPCSFIIGDYNVENMAPTSAHIPTVADHIANYLKTPDLIFVQEIQDDTGPTDDGVVTANKTLSALVAAIKTASGVEYSFIDVAPENDKDGGQPGGNIRVAYLYLPNKVSLVPGSPVGGALDANEVIVDAAGALGLKYNPGRIEPASAAWVDSRKPLVAAWQTVSGERFFTVNVHFASKGGSSSSQGDARPPVNGVAPVRQSQVNVTATFLRTLLEADPSASVVIGGDMNEYIMTRGVFQGFQGLVYDIDEAAGVPPVERYTYVYDQNTQELDHIFISGAVKDRGVRVEHVHVNTWSPTYKSRISDHDPSVAEVKVCTNLQKYTGAVGGIPPPAITRQNGKYYTGGKSYSLLAAARTKSCNVQLAQCSTYVRGRQDVNIVDCAGQETKCLLKVLA